MTLQEVTRFVEDQEANGLHVGYQTHMLQQLLALIKGRSKQHRRTRMKHGSTVGKRSWQTCTNSFPQSRFFLYFSQADTLQQGLSLRECRIKNKVKLPTIFADTHNYESGVFKPHCFFFYHFYIQKPLKENNCNGSLPLLYIRHIDH